MSNFLKEFYYEEEGMGTVEIVIIIAVLVALALIFKDAISKYANNLMEKFFNANDADNEMAPPNIPDNT